MLHIDRLRLTYASPHGPVVAVADASLDVAAHEAVGLVGESGSGKSSLARAVLGLLPQGTGQGTGRIEAGTIRVGGTDVRALTRLQWERFRGHPVAMVFQDPLSSLNPVMRIGTQIAESVARHDKAAGPGRVAALLGLVRLAPDAAGAYPHELSGGMRQRALLAVALGCRPSLLIADEPTTALDVTIQAEILALLRELQTRLGMALLLISHDLGVVAAASDRVVILYAGRTVEWGPTAAVFARPGHPYTAALLQAGTASRDAAGRFVTIEGEAAPASDDPGCPFAPRCPVALARCGAEMPPAFQVEGETHAARCWRLA